MLFFYYILSKVYCFLVCMWHKLYLWKFLPTYKFQTTIISVGNLSVGGTGKTPMVIFLSKLLAQHNISHAIVSRGYKKTTSGLMVLNKKNINTFLPHQCGDEPYMIAKKTDGVSIVVDKNKRRGIQYAINQINPQIILLDDGFQSIKIHRQLDIVLINSICNKEDLHLLPLGKMREPIQNISRANIIIYTKQKLAASLKNQFPIKEFISSNASIASPYMESNISAKILLCNVPSMELQPFDSYKEIESVLCVCGIGDPQSFLHTCKQFFSVVDFISFPDHYQYSDNEFIALLQQCVKLKIGALVTTYKDFVKIQHLENKIKKFSIKLLIIDIDISLTNQELLIDKIKKLILV